MTTLAADDPLAVAVTAEIHTGDVEGLEALLAMHGGLARATIVDGKGHGRTLLHVATDWPGNFPNGPAVVAALTRAGTDVNARFVGPHRETPLHWAASCDDVAMINALLDAGADIEADGSVIDGGTPLADAVAFGQWKAARALVERGARPNLWQAAGLGLMQHVRSLKGDVNLALWCAAHGGQHEAAEFLLAQGADPHHVGHDNLTPAQAAARGGFHSLADWLRSR